MQHVQTTRNQLPWRYRNIGLLTDARPTSIQDALVDLHVCLHILVWLYNTFKWGAVWNTLSWSQNILAEHHLLSIQGNSLNVTPQVDSWVGKGVDQRTFGPAATPLPIRSPSQNPSGGERCDAAPPQVAELRDNNPQRMVKISSKDMSPRHASIWKGMVEDSQSQKQHKT